MEKHIKEGKDTLCTVNSSCLLRVVKELPAGGDALYCEENCKAWLLCQCMISGVIVMSCMYNLTAFKQSKEIVNLRNLVKSPTSEVSKLLVKLIVEPSLSISPKQTTVGCEVIA